MLAHERAYVDARILHCDVSSGNILVYPKVKCEKDGRRCITWGGMLVDWEMSITRDLERSRSLHDQTVCPVLNQFNVSYYLTLSVGNPTVHVIQVAVYPLKHGALT